jgi:hypothetical protein
MELELRGFSLTMHIYLFEKNALSNSNPFIADFLTLSTPDTDTFNFLKLQVVGIPTKLQFYPIGKRRLRVLHSPQYGFSAQLTFLSLAATLGEG